jgi:hypothetical protein
VLSGLEEKVEWVEPGGNYSGEIKYSIAHKPAIGDILDFMPEISSMMELG